MNGLLLLAHGSKQAGANAATVRLTRRLADQVADRFELVSAAFLQFGTPGIETEIDRHVAAGVTSLVLIPFFLAPGRHVDDDIPAVVAATREKYPELHVRVVPHIGAAPGMVDFISQQL